MSALREAMSHAVLGWVKPELDQTLRLVRGEIEAFAENLADTARMQACVGYLHQVQGTLHMVELYAPAMVAEELEKLAQALQDNRVADANEACATLMRGTVLLPDYLERLQSGHRDIPIVLLPLLNDIRAARGETGLSESVLFAPDLDRPLPQDVPATEPLPGNTREIRFAQACDHFERILSGWSEDAAPADAGALASALQPLQRLAEHTVARRMLWVATSVAEAMRDGAIAPSPALHQAFVGVDRVVRQIRQGLVPGAAAPGQEPTRQLLYQVAKTDAAHPALEDLRQAFDLAGASPSQAEIEHARSSISGRNRALLDTVGGAVKEELMRVKDALDLQLRTGAQIAELAPLVAELGSIADTLGMMGQGLARNVVLQQRESLAELVDGRRTPDESALLDIAGALLYVDASLDDQAANLAEEGTSQPQASESQNTVEVLAGEAIRNFAEVRHQFVAFIEMDWDHGQLADTPRLLEEVCGALRMLELAEPADYVEGVRRYIATELIERKRVPSGTQLDTLADAMASLEYYLEALRERRPNRDELMDIARSSLEALRYWPLPVPSAAAAEDIETAAVEPVHETPPSFAPATAEPTAVSADDVPPHPALSQDAPSSAPAEPPVELERGPELPAYVPDEAAFAQFDPVASEYAEYADQLPIGGLHAALPEVGDVAPQAVADTPAVAVADEALIPAAAIETGAPALESGFDASGQDIDDEIRDVFLEEFDEEIASLHEMLPGWRADPDNLERLRSIRRVFHTLKGSGRLVGARQLGEFAWKIENTLNRVLDGTRAPTPAVVAMLDQATATLPQLNQALRGQPGVTADLAGIEHVAERIAQGEEAFYSAPSAAPAPVEAAGHDLAHAEQTAVAAPEFDLEGTPASVDSVLREILEAEVANHLQTVDGWLAQWTPGREGLAASESLLRAFHTLNGAFAMADVPEITEVTGRAEQYIKRALGNGASIDPAGVAGLAAATVAVRHTMTALQAEQARIPHFTALCATLSELRDGLPQAPRPLSTVIDDRRQNTYAGQGATDFTPDIPAGTELTGAMDLSRFIDTPESTGPGMPAPEQPGGDAASRDDVFDLDHGDHAQLSAEPIAQDGEGPEVSESDLSAGLSFDPVAAEFDAPAEQPDTPLEVENGEPQALVEPDDIERTPVQDPEVDVETLDAAALPATSPETEEALVLEDAAAWSVAPVDADAVEDVDLTPPEAAAEAAAWAETLSPQVVEEAIAPAAPEAEAVFDAPENSIAEDAQSLAAGATEDPRPDLPIVGEASSDDTPADGPAETTVSQEDPGVAVVDAPQPPVSEPPASAAARTLDFEMFDRDLVDIFVEEGNDLLDHSDGLLARLRDTPDDRSLVIGLQRDLHTIKGGARMAGISAIGDLGHAIESLLEQVAEHRAEVDRGVVGLLERGFDVLHGMLARTADYLVVESQPQLVAEFDARAQGATLPDEASPVAVEPVESEEAGTPTTGADVSESLASDASEAPADFTVAMDDVGATSESAVTDDAGQREAAEAVEHAAPSFEADAPTDVVEVEEVAADDLEAVAFDRTVSEPAEAEDVMASADPDAEQANEEAPLPAQDVEGIAFDAGVDAPVSTPGNQELAETVDTAAFEEPAPSEAEATHVVHAVPEAPAHLEAPETEREVQVAATAAFDTPAAPRPLEALAAVAAVATPGPQPIPHLAPLSAPIDLEAAGEEDTTSLSTGQEQVRVRADLLDQLVNNAGEVAIYRARLEQQMGAFRAAMAELDRTNTRLHDQLRRLDLETEAQIVARYQREHDTRDAEFDPLELDRFSTLQQLSRALAESAADISGLQGVLDDLARQNDSLLGQQSRVSSELQDGLMRARMVPFEGSVPRLRRVLRQAAQDTGKQAQLQLEGAHGELDRNVLERMTAPLEHLLRNAVAHGLESPQARRDAGKPEEGSVRVVLRREGSEMVLQVADDGAGIDHAAIRRRAEQRGILKPGAELSEMDLERLILEPGFSTAEEVSQLAGRGVGMDVVHNEVRQLGGTLEIASVAGRGTTFTLRLPQTLAVTQAVFVQVGETQFAVSVAAVGGVGRLSRERFDSGASYVYGGEEYALHDMGTLVGLDPAKAEGQPVVPLLLVRAGELRAAVAVDQVLGNREIVVKPVGPQIGSIPGIYGATITGDGSVVVILDAAPLVRRYMTQPTSITPVVAVVEQRQVPLVMVVDDSLTMRKVTSRVLERHNFEVSTARDGVEALERLEERVPDLMLLDIEMPRMDGYELATAMKADPRFAGVPIVMITSRTGDKHRQRALEIGVQRYMGKPYQELDLMRNVYDLLGIARVRD